MSETVRMAPGREGLKIDPAALRALRELGPDAGVFRAVPERIVAAAERT